MRNTTKYSTTNNYMKIVRIRIEIKLVIHDWNGELPLMTKVVVRGEWGWDTLPNLDNLPFRRAKTVVQCSSTGEITGPRTIGQLLLVKNKKFTGKKFSAGQPLAPPKISWSCVSDCGLLCYDGTKTDKIFCPFIKSNVKNVNGGGGSQVKLIRVDFLFFLSH